MDTMDRDIIEVRADGGARKRREYSPAFKRRLVAQSLEPGASVSQIAQRHGLNTNLLFTWRRDPQYATQGQFPAVTAPAPKLLAVSVADDVGDAKQETEAKQTDASAAFIEIEVGVSRVRLHGGVDMHMVAGVLRLLERVR
jgi:transposase